MKNLTPTQQELLNYLKKNEIMCLQEYFEDFTDEIQNEIRPALLSLVSKGFITRNGDCFRLDPNKL